MPFTIEPSVDGNYIILTMVGDMTREVANEHVVEAHALGAELGIRCYLVDVTASRNVESVLGNYKFAHRDVRSLPGVDRHACVAVLAARDDDSHDFYEALAQNAGLDVTLFRDRDAAIAHLQAGAERLKPRPKQANGS